MLGHGQRGDEKWPSDNNVCAGKSSWASSDIAVFIGGIAIVQRHLDCPGIDIRTQC